VTSVFHVNLVWISIKTHFCILLYCSSFLVELLIVLIFLRQIWSFFVSVLISLPKCEFSCRADLSPVLGFQPPPTRLRFLARGQVPRPIFLARLSASVSFVPSRASHTGFRFGLCCAPVLRLGARQSSFHSNFSIYRLCFIFSDFCCRSPARAPVSTSRPRRFDCSSREQGARFSVPFLARILPHA
jgi:hypothetical protein